MTWWNRKSKPDDEIRDPEKSFGGTYSVPADRLVGGTLPEAPGGVPYSPEPSTDPEPDLSTKPADIVGFCFGYACPEKHVMSFFESITTNEFNQRRACQKCGEVSRPAVVKRTAEPRWTDRSKSSRYGRDTGPDWGWYIRHNSTFGLSLNFGDPIWNKFEFVRFLDDPEGE